MFLWILISADCPHLLLHWVSQRGRGRRMVRSIIVIKWINDVALQFMLGMVIYCWLSIMFWIYYCPIEMKTSIRDPLTWPLLIDNLLAYKLESNVMQLFIPHCCCCLFCPSVVFIANGMEQSIISVWIHFPSYLSKFGDKNRLAVCSLFHRMFVFQAGSIFDTSGFPSFFGLLHW